MRRSRATFIALFAAGFLAVGVNPAMAAGAVANSCAVTDVVTAVVPAPGGGDYWYRLGCGQGMSNVKRATVLKHPFYVKLPGLAPNCMKAGQWFYPNNTGLDRTAVLTPTVRCK
jgi:hypothetical protein